MPTAPGHAKHLQASSLSPRASCTRRKLGLEAPETGWKPVLLSRSSRNLQHPLNGQSGALQQVAGQFDARREVRHAVVELLQRVELHVSALVAAAVVGRRRDEVLAGTFLLQ